MSDCEPEVREREVRERGLSVDVLYVRSSAGFVFFFFAAARQSLSVANAIMRAAINTHFLSIGVSS